jgi:hypothetical protein
MTFSPFHSADMEVDKVKGSSILYEQNMEFVRRTIVSAKVQDVVAK